MRYLTEVFNKDGKREFYEHHDDLAEAIEFFNNCHSEDGEIVTLAQQILGSWTTQFKTGAHSHSQNVIMEVKGMDVAPHKLITFAIDDSANPLTSCCSVYLRQYKA